MTRMTRRGLAQVNFLVQHLSLLPSQLVASVKENGQAGFRTPAAQRVADVANVESICTQVIAFGLAYPD